MEEFSIKRFCLDLEDYDYGFCKCILFDLEKYGEWVCKFLDD